MSDTDADLWKELEQANVQLEKVTNILRDQRLAEIHKPAVLPDLEPQLLDSFKA